MDIHCDPQHFNSLFSLVYVCVSFLCFSTLFCQKRQSSLIWILTFLKDICASVCLSCSVSLWAWWLTCKVCLWKPRGDCVMFLQQWWSGNKVEVRAHNSEAHWTVKPGLAYEQPLVTEQQSREWTKWKTQTAKKGTFILSCRTSVITLMSTK